MSAAPNRRPFDAGRAAYLALNSLLLAFLLQTMLRRVIERVCRRYGLPEALAIEPGRNARLNADTGTLTVVAD